MKYICSECGSEIPEEDEFCSHCGAMRSKALVMDDNGKFDTSKCPNCGAPVTGNENFCGSCGAALIRETALPMKPVKYAWLALALAIIPGFFNVFGLGHLVLKKWSRAFMFLAITCILYFVGAALDGFVLMLLQVGVFMFQAFDIMNYMYTREAS